jgi:hypothetical protein
MKQILISIGGGLLLLCVWGAIVVATSQDFAHEGPNSVWFWPVEAWSRVLIDAGWSRRVSTFSPILGLLLGVALLLGPFVLALSIVARLAVRLLSTMMTTRKLR